MCSFDRGAYLWSSGHQSRQRSVGQTHRALADEFDALVPDPRCPPEAPLPRPECRRCSEWREDGFCDCTAAGGNKAALGG
ncbi:hypothetical protein AB1Y20_015787 [Prymnesium parvum]|uniref:Uncharacterized protein n=1 Tax=Prymnesium parvum TaxID=97485 RepID=A0AB34JZH0_PRYPA